jgi:hypothetical protein
MIRWFRSRSFRRPVKAATAAIRPRLTCICPASNTSAFIERNGIRIDVFDRYEAGWALRPPIEAAEANSDVPALGFTIRVAEVYLGALPSGQT